jgi:hypothetical protein
MNFNVWTAGRLLKSAVVFLKRINLLPAKNAIVRIRKKCFQNSMRNPQVSLLLVLPDILVVADAAADLAVTVITNLIYRGVIHEERFYLHC